MTIEIAHGVGPARIDIAYERLGDPQGPPVVLIMGLAAQLIAWPDGFCDELIARGLRVIRFDNRDVGESTHVSADYTLSDLAADTVGLLDALGIDRAHLVGASMGGFIAQTIAIEHPRRVRSLASIMSSTGDPRVGRPRPEVMRAFAGPTPSTRAEIIERTVGVARAVASPAYPPDLDEVVARTSRAYDRAFDPPGIARQAAAVAASGDRTAKLRSIEVPAVVIHGAEDRLIDVSGGRATASAIPGAELVVIEGMGHDLPRALWTRLADLIELNVLRA